MGHVQEEDRDFSPEECHQIRALVNKIGRACNGKSSDIVGVALQSIAADVAMQISDDEQDLHQGIDCFCSDVKALVSLRLFAKRTAH